MSSERLSDARLAVLMSHAENFGELLIGPSNLAALVSEVQEYRSDLVQTQIAFAEGYAAMMDAIKACDRIRWKDPTEDNYGSATYIAACLVRDQRWAELNNTYTALLAAAPTKGGET